MSKIEQGGSAFPWESGYGQEVTGSSGMTMRDWFAGQALAGYFGAPHTPHQNAASAETARYMYEMADAMLSARGESQ